MNVSSNKPVKKSDEGLSRDPVPTVNEREGRVMTYPDH